MTILENIDSDEDILEYFDIVQGISVNIEFFLFPKQVLVAKNRATLLGVSLICGFGVTVSFFSKKAKMVSAEKNRYYLGIIPKYVFLALAQRLCR